LFENFDFYKKPNYHSTKESLVKALSRYDKAFVSGLDTIPKNISAQSVKAREMLSYGVVRIF